MEENKKKVSSREAWRLHRRAAKLFYAERPALHAVNWLYAAFKSLSPYVLIYLSAQIIGELTGTRDAHRLTVLAVAAVAAASLLPLITAALERRQTVLYDNSFYINQKIYANKLLDMDFPRLDDPKTHDDLSQILQNEKWSGYGLGRVLDVETKLPMSVFGVLGVVALTVTLFTQRVPESAGAWTVLNHPLFLLGCLLLLALLSVLPSLCMNRASMLTAELAPLARLGNRFFNFFAVMAISDRDRASDIRMYNQQDICESYASSDTPFSTNGPFAKLAWGRGGVLMIVSALFSVLFTVAAYLFVCLKALAGAFGAGSVVQYVSALTALSGHLSQLVVYGGDVRSNAPFLQELFAFLDTPNEMYQGSLTTEKRSDRKYEIEFRDVSFRYPGTENWALRHLSVKFEIGKKLAVVGPNGSGKTTFIKLLCRLYDPTEGEILLNGIDIRKYNNRESMDVFSVVFQDFQLLAFSLGQNVAAAPEYDRARAEKALAQAGFGDRLKALPLGTETSLFRDFDENGVEVSGGEGQKIAIARALYKDAPFLILDEPTAALDPIAEAEIYEKLNDMVGDKTAIYISHRLSSCKFCDEIVVFDAGKIIQQGAHEALLADESGEYAQLWNAQAQYYR